MNSLRKQFFSMFLSVKKKKNRKLPLQISRGEGGGERGERGGRERGWGETVLVFSDLFCPCSHAEIPDLSFRDFKESRLKHIIRDRRTTNGDFERE